VLGSWDAEEQGLIGSTEWGEQHEKELANAAAYFNMDVAVSGPKFGASSVPSLKQFLRDITRVVPSPDGESVYAQWQNANRPGAQPAPESSEAIGSRQVSAAESRPDVPVGDLGSGSDYTFFLQHLGVPATDISSTGSYGVYHSAFDNFSWFQKFADPHFLYEQQMARIFGLEILRMTEADVLPYNYEEYGQEVAAYVEAAQKKAEAQYGVHAISFDEAIRAAHRFSQAGARILRRQKSPPSDPTKLNETLRAAERGLLIPDGLPNRPWFRHVVYAPGEYTGYAAVVIPGINEAIDQRDLSRSREQVGTLAAALNRAAAVLAHQH
jgi:N-acetylated-alpha-linked acidic dipeptidase